jgi:hypothetical protein
VDDAVTSARTIQFPVVSVPLPFPGSMSVGAQHADLDGGRCIASPIPRVSTRRPYNRSSTIITSHLCWNLEDDGRGAVGSYGARWSLLIAMLVWCLFAGSLVGVQHLPVHPPMTVLLARSLLAAARRLLFPSAGSLLEAAHRDLMQRPSVVLHGSLGFDNPDALQ